MHVDREWIERQQRPNIRTFLFVIYFVVFPKLAFSLTRIYELARRTQFDYCQSQIANMVISLCGNSVSSNHPT